MSKKIFISGATSAIAHAFARRYAVQGAHFCLLGRNPEKLAIVKDDLLARGASSVETVVIDFSSRHDYTATVNQAWQQASGFDIALLAQGVLTDEKRSHTDLAYLQESFQVNALSVIQLATVLGEKFAEQGKGSLLLISSPAGDRGREKNYVYGSAKAAVSVFCDGLRNRLNKTGVQVVTVKPGFIRTPMTTGFDQSGPLWADADVVASDLENAIIKGKSSLYTPWFWRYIMLVIRHIPEFIFKKLSI
ncbi:MAG: SDR family oxidoreductase [Pseudomonadales bacterium]|nr:SDR family oxidoreductase [Pseudomonadales bacterium]